MKRAVVGIISNTYTVDDQYSVFAAGKLNCEALTQVQGIMPLIIPSDPQYVSVDYLLDVCDGFLLTGGRPNVHPSHYGAVETEKYGTFDHGRDAIALELIKKAVDRGQPIMGICRGFQEVAVAMGSTLHPEIREIEGRMNHRMPPDGTLEEKFALRHEVEVIKDGPFHKIFGQQRIMTNTLHGQGILEPSDNIVIDGYALDGTPEALYVKNAKGFTYSVQWHPEWNATNDPVSKPLFEAFGNAVLDFSANRIK